MFGFTAAGAAVTAVGLVFIALVGWRLVPARRQSGVDGFETGASLTETRVPAVMLVTTMVFTDLMNNAATAAVMAPIALGAAGQLGVNPDTFLMAVAVGASCAFLSPIGHQNNTLILGPGGFRFGDYWKMGLPLDACVIAVALPTLLIVWPL